MPSSFVLCENEVDSNHDFPTEQAEIRRRLGAVVFADVGNYSRLMGADEIGTHLATKADRHDRGIGRGPSR